MNTDNSTNQKQRPDPAVSAALNFIRTDGKPAYSKPRSPVYVAGPMTGQTDLNYPAFDTAAKHLRGYGFVVENPAENERPNPTPTWAEWMRLGLTQMLRCNSVLLLPGWHASKGAVIEARIALDLGLLVIDGETGAALPADHAVTLQQQPATTQDEADTAVQLQAITADHEQLRAAWRDIITALHQCDPQLFADPTRPAIEAAVSSVWRTHANLHQATSAAKCGQTAVAHYRAQLETKAVAA